MSALKALTLHQPWATLIALGIKTIETRSQSTNVRGRIAIHAAKRQPDNIELGEMMQVRYSRFLNAHVLDAPGNDPLDLPLGAIVATANLVDCIPMVDAYEELDDNRRVLAVHNEMLWIDQPGHQPSQVYVTDQSPYGWFAPGRYAWLLDDVRPITDWCPFCEGVGNVPAIGEDGGRWNPLCRACDGKGAFDAPVPFKGGQGWSRTWEPQ